MQEAEAYIGHCTNQECGTVTQLQTAWDIVYTKRLWIDDYTAILATVSMSREMEGQSVSTIRVLASYQFGLVQKRQFLAAQLTQFSIL